MRCVFSTRFVRALLFMLPFARPRVYSYWPSQYRILTIILIVQSGPHKYDNKSNHYNCITSRKNEKQEYSRSPYNNCHVSSFFQYTRTDVFFSRQTFIYLFFIWLGTTGYERFEPIIHFSSKEKKSRDEKVVVLTNGMKFSKNIEICSKSSMSKTFGIKVSYFFFNKV